MGEWRFPSVFTCAATFPTFTPASHEIKWHGCSSPIYLISAYLSTSGPTQLEHGCVVYPTTNHMATVGSHGTDPDVLGWPTLLHQGRHHEPLDAAYQVWPVGCRCLFDWLWGSSLRACPFTAWQFFFESAYHALILRSCLLKEGAI